MFHHLGGRIASAYLIIYEFLVDLVINFKFKFQLYFPQGLRNVLVSFGVIVAHI